MTAATSGVKLAWARDREGRRTSVLTLEPPRRRERGPFSCPGCGQEVVPRLGRVRARHFAHRPGSLCPLTAPETALHLNAKMRLLELAVEAVAGRRRVILALRCPSCRRPAPHGLASLGDAAVLEGGILDPGRAAVPGRRPSAGVRPGRRATSAGAARPPDLRADVLVTRRGVPSLCLEVRVAHALEPGKEDALRRLGLAAAEIDARSAWEREEAGATVVTCDRSLGFPPCPACAAAARAEQGRSRGGEEAALAELEAYRARGLMGPPPGPPVADAAPLSRGERRQLERAFRCPLCSGRALDLGERLVRHACPGGAPRAVAWRGYDGALVELQWWREPGR